MDTENLPESASPSAATPIYGMETINRVLRALYNYKKPATYKELASHSGLHTITTSQALSSSRDVGLSRLAGKRGLYDLSPEGIDYARFLTAGKEEDARRVLRQVILSNPLWTEVVSFLRTNLNTARDPTDIVIGLERKLGKQWSQAMRAKVADSYASILSYAGLARIESGNIVSLLTQNMDSSEQLIVVDQARVRDVSIFPSNSLNASDQRGVIDRTDASRPDFAEFKDENVMIRVRKDVQSISFAKSFLDFVETGLRSQKNKDKINKTAGESEGEVAGKS